MQIVMSLIIYMNESKLQPQGQPKLISDLEQKKSRSGLQLKRSDKGL